MTDSVPTSTVATVGKAKKIIKPTASSLARQIPTKAYVRPGRHNKFSKNEPMFKARFGTFLGPDGHVSIPVTVSVAPVANPTVGITPATELDISPVTTLGLKLVPSVTVDPTGSNDHTGINHQSDNPSSQVNSIAPICVGAATVVIGDSIAVLAHPTVTPASTPSSILKIVTGELTGLTGVSTGTNLADSIPTGLVPTPVSSSRSLDLGLAANSDTDIQNGSTLSGQAGVGQSVESLENPIGEGTIPIDPALDPVGGGGARQQDPNPSKKLKTVVFADGPPSLIPNETSNDSSSSLIHVSGPVKPVTTSTVDPRFVTPVRSRWVEQSEYEYPESVPLSSTASPGYDYEHHLPTEIEAESEIHTGTGTDAIVTSRLAGSFFTPETNPTLIGPNEYQYVTPVHQMIGAVRARDPNWSYHTGTATGTATVTSTLSSTSTTSTPHSDISPGTGTGTGTHTHTHESVGFTPRYPRVRFQAYEDGLDIGSAGGGGDRSQVGSIARLVFQDGDGTDADSTTDGVTDSQLDADSATDSQADQNGDDDDDDDDDDRAVCGMINVPTDSDGSTTTVTVHTGATAGAALSDRVLIDRTAGAAATAVTPALPVVPSQLPQVSIQGRLSPTTPCPIPTTTLLPDHPTPALAPGITSVSTGPALPSVQIQVQVQAQNQDLVPSPESTSNQHST